MSEKKRFRKLPILLAISALSIGLGAVVVTQTDKGGNSLKELNDMNQEILEMKDSLENKESTPDSNLVDSISKFLEMKSEEKELPIIGKFITGDYNNVNGVYAYAGKLEKVGKEVTVDTGLSMLRVSEAKFESYSSFTDTIYNAEQGDSGLTLVTYVNNNISRVEFYKLSPNFDVLLASVAEAEFPTNAKETKEEEKGTDAGDYSGLQADDWKVMASMISREIEGRDLAPVFIVPNVDQTLGKEIDGTFYYLVLGEVVSSDGTNTKLKTYEGKTITINIPLKDAEQFLGHPSLLHIVTNESTVASVEVQLFKGASISEMSEGIMAHIQSVLQ